jgi:hypothetical protein
VLVHLRRKVQVLVDVACIRIAARANRKVLLLLELADFFRLGRAVAARLHLHHQRAGLLSVEALALGELLGELIVVEEMAGDSRLSPERPWRAGFAFARSCSPWT